jgi:hypothetical protein
VAAYLVPRIRDVPPKSSTLTGGVASTYIQYLTKPKAFSQIISVSSGHTLNGLCSTATSCLLCLTGRGERILYPQAYIGVASSGQVASTYIQYLTKPKAFGQILR